MVFALLGLFQKVFIYLNPAWAFDSSIKDKQFQRCVCSSENILKIVAFTIWGGQVDIFKAIPDLVLRSWFSVNAINLEYVLLCLKFSNFNVNFLPFQLIINLFLGFFHKFFAYLFSLKLLLFQRKIKLSKSLIGNYVNSLAILHYACNEELISRKLVDLSKVEFYLLRQLEEGKHVYLAALCLYLHLRLGFLLWYCHWSSLSVRTV